MCRYFWNYNNVFDYEDYVEKRVPFLLDSILGQERGRMFL